MNKFADVAGVICIAGAVLQSHNNVGAVTLSVRAFAKLNCRRKWITDTKHNGGM